ncbi:DALR anticodon-binding domain-containing protein 3 [Anoplophora glabripennis]|uniref:DALR anticodon-binding domain-containing protein 3 n=1 Tax=Anoplophora glabripennis TaxID=217634 RepID=UPI00087560F9|nr:DALR anticodon-binding domain-containing protein 3 [Anoplophora glabripennis]
MRLMAEHRYKVQVIKNTPREDYFIKMMKKLGRACVTIEMLSNKPSKSLKVTLNDLRTANRGAAFIFYNCARLSVLLKEFEKRVLKGIYPAHPDVTEVDFSVLNQPEEWELFYVYILQFPLVIKGCIKDICKNIFNPQYLVTFLSNLSSLFSAYYRRVRILTDPRQHLVPVLHGRIYLLKALQVVFHNSLILLNIEPIKEM